MTLGRGEVAAIDVADSLSTLKRRWLALVGAAITGAIVAAVWTLFLTPVWEATGDVQLGIVHGQPLEDGTVLLRFLAGPNVRTSIIGPWIARPEAAPPDVVPVSYLRVQARGATPQAARDEARRVIDLVSSRHRDLFDKIASRYAEYEHALTQTVTDLEASNAQIQASVAKLDKEGAGAVALGALLLQQQLERNRTSYLDVKRQLAATRLREPINTRATEAIRDVVVSDSPVWPEAIVFVAIGVMVGLALGVAGVLAGRPSTTGH